jgi:hypothetical protein
VPSVIRSTRIPRLRSPLTLFAVAVPLGLLMTTACSDTTSTATTVTSITASLGSGQTDTVQRVLPDSLAVLVTDVNNVPVSGVTVTWTASALGGVPSSSTVVTNGSGVAKIAWTLGAIAGPDTMTASVLSSAGTTASAMFTATATAGAPAAVTPAPAIATTQSATTGTVIPLIVTVIDQYDNVVTGATVTWTVTQGAGYFNGSSATTTLTTTTNASGQADVLWTLGAGSSTVTATITTAGGTTQSATFTGTGT